MGYVDKKIKAIQLQNKRVGSTFLQKCMDSHPEIRGIDEIFVNKIFVKNARKSGYIPFVKSGMDLSGYINYIWNDNKNTHTIFKLMYNQINYHQGLKKYIIDNNIPIIHVLRRNLVKQVISSYTASDSVDRKVEELTPDILFNKVTNADDLNIIYENLFSTHKYLKLYYEDLIGKTTEEFTFVSKNVNIKICNFFRVKNVPMKCETKKKNKDDIWIYLVEKDRIKSMFKNTKYEWMLE
jgi:hypothetical protein